MSDELQFQSLTDYYRSRKAENISLFTKVKISSILASIISINSELFIILFLLLSLHVFNIISLSLSINDFKASPYCLFNLSASSFSNKEDTIYLLF